MLTEDGRELVEYARDRLRDAILTDQLKASHSFSQVQLAKEFGISRTPLREAVRLLEYEGLTTVSFNRQVRVADLSAEDLDAIYAERILLEAVALNTLMRKADAATFERSREWLTAMEAAEEARDLEAWSKAHRAFHLGFVLGTNRRIDQRIVHLFDHAERYRRVYLGGDSGNWNKSSADHVALQLACENGDTTQAVLVLIEHYVTTASGVFKTFDAEFDPVLIRAAKTMAKGAVFIE